MRYGPAHEEGRDVMWCGVEDDTLSVWLGS